MAQSRPFPLRNGFTLIELLVVIAIITVLLALLLPMMGAAREQARSVACLSNLKQTSMAFFQYAGEYRSIPGTYWQGPINLDWSGVNNKKYQDKRKSYKHPIESSVIYPYIRGVDRIMECPTARRTANTWFDYTVVIRLAGARTDLMWYMTYLEKPNDDKSGLRFSAIPLLIEEDELWYNKTYDDGSWAWNDQISERHRRYANLGYLDGSAGKFRSPKGPNRYKEEPGDLTAQQCKLWANGKSYLVHDTNDKEFGWANNPK